MVPGSLRKGFKWSSGLPAGAKQGLPPQANRLIGIFPGKASASWGRSLGPQGRSVPRSLDFQGCFATVASPPGLCRPVDGPLPPPCRPAVDGGSPTTSAVGLQPR